MRHTPDCINRLQAAGVSYDDAVQLRRISMTLHRWHELECGDSNDYGSFALVRGFYNGVDPFSYSDEGKPFIEHHHYGRGKVKDAVSYTSITDREAGAKRRLARILKNYPHLSAYIQTDPRGCALYILKPGDVPEGEDASAYYSRGVAVYK